VSEVLLAWQQATVAGAVCRWFFNRWAEALLCRKIILQLTPEAISSYFHSALKGRQGQVRPVHVCFWLVVDCVQVPSGFHGHGIISCHVVQVTKDPCHVVEEGMSVPSHLIYLSSWWLLRSDIEYLHSTVLCEAHKTAWSNAVVEFLSHASRPWSRSWSSSATTLMLLLLWKASTSAQQHAW
jgi:hypothetical protein